METDSHKLFRKLQRQVYSDAKNNMIYRYKRYAGYGMTRDRYLTFWYRSFLES